MERVQKNTHFTQGWFNKSEENSMQITIVVYLIIERFKAIYDYWCTQRQSDKPYRKTPERRQAQVFIAENIIIGSGILLFENFVE